MLICDCCPYRHISASLYLIITRLRKRKKWRSNYESSFWGKQMTSTTGQKNEWNLGWTERLTHYNNKTNTRNKWGNRKCVNINCQIFCRWHESEKNDRFCFWWRQALARVFSVYVRICILIWILVCICYCICVCICYCTCVCICDFGGGLVWDSSSV